MSQREENYLETDLLFSCRISSGPHSITGALSRFKAFYILLSLFLLLKRETAGYKVLKNRNAAPVLPSWLTVQEQDVALTDDHLISTAHGHASPSPKQSPIKQRGL